MSDQVNSNTEHSSGERVESPPAAPHEWVRPTDDAVDEAVARIMEESGAATRDSGWQWRELRDYAHNLKVIVLEMLDSATDNAAERETETQQG